MEMACDSGHNPRGKEHLLFSGVTLYVLSNGHKMNSDDSKWNIIKIVEKPSLEIRLTIRDERRRIHIYTQRENKCSSS